MLGGLGGRYLGTAGMYQLFVHIQSKKQINNMTRCWLSPGKLPRQTTLALHVLTINNGQLPLITLPGKTVGAVGVVA